MMKNNVVGMIAAGLAGGALALGGAFFMLDNSDDAPQVVEKKIVEAPSENSIPVRQVLFDGSPESSKDFTHASSETVNAVVHITTTYESSYNRDPFYEYFYGPGYGQAKASGSGVILTDDGYIVTNNHVIEGADKIEVALNDQRGYTAKLIGTDPATDLALLKIEEKDLPHTKLGNSDAVKVGEWVLAVGNPFNLTSTVTAGIVSAKARSINILQYDPDKEIFPIESFIQTDAAVNPGNSGGALVNAEGELVGINTAIASKTGSYSGYSFAVPVNIMKKVTKDLMEFGQVQRAFIGVNIRGMNQLIADELNVKEVQGVYVTRVISGGAAESGGILEGDIITKIGTVMVNNVPELQEQIGRFRPGDKISVTLRRSGSEKVMSLTLKNKNGNTDVVESKTEAEVVNVLGGTFKNASSKELKALQLDGGVKIAKLSSGKLRTAGIREGFIITKVDSIEVTDASELLELLQDKKGGVLIEGIYPNGMKGYYAFGL
jgi:Do/DeqQ family serine protease